MGKIIAFANHKGGVGKTTSTALIGEALAKLGKRVLLVDLDPQANLTSFFTDQEPQISIYDTLVEGTALPILKVSENLDLVPSELRLAGAEIQLSALMAREYILRKALKPYRDSYDYMLLDCSPSLGVITTNALAASTDVIIPLTPEALPLRGMATLEHIVQAVKDDLNEDLRLFGIIITRYNNRNLNKSVLEAIQAAYGDKMFNTRIRENIAVAETPAGGGNIFDYAPTSNGSKDYMELAKEIIDRE